MATTFAVKKIVPAAPIPPTKEGVEAASQSFPAGAPLINSSGKIAVYAGSGKIIGFAMNDASGTTDDPVVYYPEAPGQEWYGTFLDALAQTDFELAVGLVADGTTGIWGLDRDDTTDETIMVDINARGYNDGEIGDTNCRVKFVIDQSTAGSDQ